MRFLHNILAKAGLIVDGVTQLNTIANATIDTDKFLVSDGGVIKYRTGAELGSDIGAANLAASTLKHQVKLGEAINKGQAVYVSSADGTNMIVSKASNASEATSSKTLGLIETSGVLNDQVNVVTEGLLAGLDTSTAAAGDPVWLGTGGNLIFGLANKPYAPAHLVFIGIVTRVQQNNGEIFVKVQNGFELKEIHDVQITTTPSNNTVLAYESATSLYKMKSIATLLGYTPADDSLVVHLAGTETITGAKTFSSALTLSTVANATIDTDRFLVSDSGVVKYRTGAEVLSDIGAQPLLTNPVTGTGTTNYLAKFTSSSAVGNSQLFDNGTNVGINTASPNVKLDVVGGNGDGIQYRTSTRAIGIGQVSNEPSIFWGSGTPLTFFSGSELMRITAAGNVGIGTTSPVEKLDVNGNITITNGNYVSLASNNPTYTRLYRSGGLLLENNTFQAILADNGNFGIGTTSPGSKLQVNSVAGNYGIVNTNGTVSVGTYIEASNSYASFGTSSNHPLGFFTNNNAPQMYITTAGNVGIGTTSPGTRLVVQQSADNAIGFSVTNPTGRASVFGYSSTFQLDIGSSTNDNIRYGNFGVGSGVLSFLNNGSEAMRITSGGDLLVGTTSGTSRIQAVGKANEWVTDLQASTTSGQSYGLVIRAGTSSGDFPFYVLSADNSTAFMAIKGNGNVGIGTTSPSQALDVLGIVNIGRNQNSNVTNLNINSGSTPVSAFQISTDQPNLLAYLNSRNSYALGFYTNDAERMRLDVSGRLLVGQTTAYSTAKVQVGGANSTTSANSIFAVQKINEGYGMYFGVVGSGTSWIQSSDATETYRYSLALQPNGGNVGIGTGSPSYNLHISSASNETGIGLTSTATGGRTYRIFTNPAWGAGSLQIYDATADVSRISIFSNGNVAINSIVDAGYRLDVNGIVRATGETIVSGGTLYLNNTDNSQAAYLVSTGTGGSAPLIIATNSTERMRITSGGSVGIGTSSPQARLQVTNSTSDGIIVSTTANVEPFLAFWRNSASNGVGVLRLIDGGNLYFDNGATGAAQATKMQIAATGAVRINSYGSGSFTGTVAYNLAVDASGNIIETAGGVVDGSGTANYVPLWSDPNTLTNSTIYQTGGGNVGINTASPAYKLDVNGTARASGMTLNAFATGTSGGNLELGFDGTQGVVQAYNRSASWIPLFLSGSDMRFYPGGVEKMRLDSVGNLGIGTTSPQANLVVQNASGTSIPSLGSQGGHFQLQNGTYGLLAGVAGSGNVWMQAQRTDGTATAYNLLLQPNGGNVGIGTTSINASAKLQVDSTTQGFLPPRMTQTQRDAITTPATGLIIFQTDNNAGFYFYNGTAWKALAIVQ